MSPKVVLMEGKRTLKYSDEIKERYAEQIRAFSLWMKHSGYTEATQKEYIREVLSFLQSLEGSPIEEAG
ncbi:hypothetical protein ACFVAP_26895, partial [Paenibacillus chitinolyticus]